MKADKKQRLPIERFRDNIRAADHYLAMLAELRGFKDLPARGRLNGSSQYLMWLPRAAVAASLSALDCYVHDVL